MKVVQVRTKLGIQVHATGVYIGLGGTHGPSSVHLRMEGKTKEY